MPGLTLLSSRGVCLLLGRKGELVCCLGNHHGTSVLNNSRIALHRGDVRGVLLNRAHWKEGPLELCDLRALN